jgi:hypothetical protein
MYPFTPTHTLNQIYLYLYGRTIEFHEPLIELDHAC